jgi:hypothetical protein
MSQYVYAQNKIYKNSVLQVSNLAGTGKAGFASMNYNISFSSKRGTAQRMK